MTLVEIMVALVLLGIIGGVIMRVILRQQRFYQGATQIMSTRSQLRQATSVLPVDLRSLSSVGGDVIEATDSSMQFRVNVGTSIVCQIVDGYRVALPPLELASKQTLTSWAGGVPPEDGEAIVAFIYNDSLLAGNEEDRWQEFRLKRVTYDASKCLGPWFTSIADVGKLRPVLELTSSDPSDGVTGGPISRYIKVGAPVRLARRVQYRLYQDPDGKWYLGYSEFDRGLGTFKQLSPVSGPYDPLPSASGMASGLTFRYYDVSGVEIPSGSAATDLARIARVDLVVRGRTVGQVGMEGVQNGVRQEYRDSLAVSVMLRNRT